MRGAFRDNNMPTLSRDALDCLHGEIINHLKQSGAFDKTRLSLMDKIWSDSNFKHIVTDFEAECRRFCQHVDLGKNRNYLRQILNQSIDIRTTSSGRMVQTHINRLLSDYNENLKKEYREQAEQLLKNYLPKLSPRHDELVDKVKDEPQQIEFEPIKLEAIETPATNDPQPIAQVKEEAEPTDNPPIEQLEQDDSQTDVPQMGDVDMDIESSDDDIERPVYSPIDIDDFIDHMNQAQQQNNESSAESSAETGADTNETRRASRTRKPNPRYSSDDYKLF